MKPDTRYRLAVASRVLAATLGGYALTWAFAVLLAFLRPATVTVVNFEREEPWVQDVSIIPFAFYLAFILWAFHVRSLGRLWGWTIGATIGISAICMVMVLFDRGGL